MENMTDGYRPVESETSLDTECLSSDATEETVDPRVQVELERLNAATDLINKLEIELDEARSSFRLLLSESSQRVNQLAKTLGSCVEKARPYYEARMRAKQLQARTQKAALRYERASSAHAAAKEMVYLAEEGLKKEGRCFDPAWQEMLNHATMRVNEAESERILSQRDHQQTSLAYNEAEKIVQQLNQEVKRAIVRSSLSTRRSLLQINNLAIQHELQLLPYFEMKARFNQLLEEQRRKVHHLEENVLKVKLSYADALHNLEEISDEIHHRRQQLFEPNVSKRSEGVGAESPEAVGNNVHQGSHFAVTASSEELFGDAYEDESYKSLPCKFSSRFAVNLEENEMPVQAGHTEEMMKRESKCVVPGALGFSEGSLSHNVSCFSSEVCTTSTLTDKIKQLNLCTKSVPHLSKLSSPQVDRSPEGAEVPNQRHHAVDLNILRVQREDLSDSESLASNDTADTLDDSQIECLLLDRVLSADYQDSFSLSEQTHRDSE